MKVYVLRTWNCESPVVLGVYSSRKRADSELWEYTRLRKMPPDEGWVDHPIRYEAEIVEYVVDHRENMGNSVYGEWDFGTVVTCPES